MPTGLFHYTHRIGTILGSSEGIVCMWIKHCHIWAPVSAKTFHCCSGCFGLGTADGRHLSVHSLYLNDFLFFMPPTGNGQLVLSEVLSLLKVLGVPVAIHKIEGSSTSITFLGIVVDTVHCKLRFPVQKNEETQLKLRWWISRHLGPYIEFETLVGNLA